MPATFKITLDPRPDREGLHDVRLRITVNRITRFRQLGVPIALKHWNPKATSESKIWIRTSHHDHRDLNDLLVRHLQRAGKVAQAHPTASADELKELLAPGVAERRAQEAKRATVPDFVTWCRQQVTEDEKSLAWGTVEGRATVINNFEQFHPSPIPLDQLTEDLFYRYERWRRGQGKKNSTIAKDLRVMSTYIKRAVRARIIPRDAHALEFYERPSGGSTEKAWLEEEELHRLGTAPLPPRQHLARSVFMLEYFLHGSRVGAVLRLRWRDVATHRVTFTADKHEHTKSVEMSEQLRALLDSLRPAQGEPAPESFVLPYLPAHFDELNPKRQLKAVKDAASIINSALKRIATKLGIAKKLTNHVSRRTLAQDADEEGGGDLRSAQHLLGHTSRRTTEIYLKGMDSKSVDKAARQVYSKRSTPSLKAVSDE